MCNGYYLPLFTKLDLYVVGRLPFDRSEFERRQRVIVRDDGRTLVVKTPEDTISRKLLWYRRRFLEQTVERRRRGFAGERGSSRRDVRR
jgi:hypothetical protein